MNDRVIHLNGRFVDETEALVPVMDRGLLFADAVYEGLGVLDGQIIDFAHHLARLHRSLSELDLQSPMSDADLWQTLMTLIDRNGLDEGFLYLQITRGTAERDYTFDAGLEPTVFAFTQPLEGAPAAQPPVPLRLWSSPDLRWARRDLKTTNLLGQVLAKQLAASHGADDALLLAPDGTVTECASRSFFIVAAGTIVARPLSTDILPGVTRRSMLAVGQEMGLRIEERTMTLEEAYAAEEAFATGASSYVEPVVAIDDRPVSDGTPGAITLELRDRYLAYARESFWSP